MIHATEAKVAAELGIDGIAHLATPYMAEPYYRVNAALLADKAPKVPKSCKPCRGTGKVRARRWCDPDRNCHDCGGTGTRMPVSTAP